MSVVRLKVKHTYRTIAYSIVVALLDAERNGKSLLVIRPFKSRLLFGGRELDLKKDVFRELSICYNLLVGERDEYIFVQRKSQFEIAKFELRVPTDEEIRDLTERMNPSYYKAIYE